MLKLITVPDKKKKVNLKFLVYTLKLKQSCRYSDLFKTWHRINGQIAISWMTKICTASRNLLENPFCFISRKWCDDKMGRVREDKC